MLFDPFSVLGSAVTHVVADSLIAALLALWSAGLWVLRLVLELEDALLTPTLTETGPMGELYAVTFWIAAALVGVLTIVQVGVALGRRDGRSIGRLLVGAAQFGFVWFAWIGYAVMLLAACSGLTRSLMRSLLSVTRWSEFRFFAPFTVNDVTNVTVAMVLGILGLLLWLAAILHVLVLCATNGSLLVLAAVTPISAAGLVTDFGRTWFWRSFRWFHAAALTPPLMVLTLGIGVKITTGVAIGAETDALKSVGTAFIGIVLICVSAFSPLALFKLFAFTDPGTTSGASLRAGLAAAGGIGGLLGGRATGNTAASTTDESGRTAGEAGAASTTMNRFGAAGGASAGSAGGGAGGAGAAGRGAPGGAAAAAGGIGGVLGPVGQAASVAWGAMAALGNAGAVLGADATNQAGVGHNNYPPDYGRRGVRASQGQPGTPNGTGGPQGDPSSDPSGPDDPTAWGGGTTPEASWGGAPASAAPPALPVASPPAGLPPGEASGTGGSPAGAGGSPAGVGAGARAGGAAAGGEAAEVALLL